MKRVVILGLILTLQAAWALSAPSSGAATIVLADHGGSAYRIVIADNATPSVRHGAEELQMFLEQMTGAALPIVSDREPLIETEILLGDNAHLAQSGIRVDIASLGLEGYHLKTAGRRLVIAGGPQRGALYGVYGLLEDHLGCRWFTPEVSRIPRLERLGIPALDERVIPVLEYREPFVFECFDGDWCARNRMNSNSGRLEAKHGGKFAFGGQGQSLSWFVHTFNRMIPPAKYFDAHPEYFSLVGGKRLKDENSGQLCCTNEDVIRLCTEAVLAAMRAEPDAHVFSVSQNDADPDAPHYCECENCQKIAREEGSQIGPVLYLVNRVAEAVEREFPQNTVETLAYQWTRHPPKHMRPRKNVVIRLCSIECCFSHPLATCDGDADRGFRKDIEDWSKTGSRLWVWDYTTDFANYLLPFPNHRLLRDNIRFFIRHGVTGIFEEDTYDTPNSEMAALDGYLLAKFLWNPEYEKDKAVTEFLEAYYGPAAASVRAYLDLLDDKVRNEDIHAGIGAPPSSAYLADDLLIKADALWRDAEKLAAPDAGALRRVQVSRLSVDYAIQGRTQLEVIGQLPLNIGLKALAVERFEPYLRTLESSGVVRLSEGSPLDLKKYRDGLAAGLGIPSGK